MFDKGKVSCQKVVTSPQVREAKRNHGRDKMMKGSEREERGQPDQMSPKDENRLGRQQSLNFCEPNKGW